MKKTMHKKPPRLVDPPKRNKRQEEGKSAAPEAGLHAVPEAVPQAPPQVPPVRPQTLSQFVGQKDLADNLGVFISAAKTRKEPLDHLLFAGPPGLGKTTLAQIVSHERGVALRATSGPVLQKPGDLAAILTHLEPHDVLFIDEIHRLAPAVEEILYPALEDFVLDLVIGSGPGAQSVRVALNPFTLVGATTRTGLITTPLRDRFGIVMRLDYYPAEALEQIVRRAAQILESPLEEDAAREIARRARGTPRIAQRLLRRVRDFALAADERAITKARTADALLRLKVDEKGLDALDHRYLLCLIKNFAGLPTGIETLSAALGETRDTLEDTVEPYLIREGFLLRTPRGRVASPKAYAHLKIPPSLLPLEEAEKGSPNEDSPQR